MAQLRHLFPVHLGISNEISNLEQESAGAGKEYIILSISVLSGLTSKDLGTWPFAHVVRDNAVPDDVYNKLAASFPTPQRFVGGLTNIANNQAIRIPAIDIIDNPEFDLLWREFFAFHTSRDFWLDSQAP